MNLTRIHYFLQVLGIKMDHTTKDDYFSKHIQFTTIYLQPKQRLKHNNYSEQKINMSYFVQATEYEMNMHAKFQYLNMHRFL
jgi:hypothetical protein